jgi:hypothetical protein
MMKNPEEAPHYRSFILVCWREHNEEAIWRFSLEDPHTGQRHGFTNPAEVIAFLETELTHTKRKNKRSFDVGGQDENQ